MSPTLVPSCFAKVVEHRYFNSCHSRLLELLQTDVAKPLIIVTGPSGVGKSTLLAQIKASVTALAAPAVVSNPETIAFGGCSVKAHGQTAFSWKDTYIQLLRSLNHPFPDGRPPRSDSPPADASMKTISSETAQRLTNERLFRMLQKTIEHRKPRAILFDEAQHLLRVGSSQSLLNQLEHLKYIADETRTPHILFGTYELIRFMDLSSAVVRRREVIHFPRYAYDPQNPESSLEPFAEAVSEFSRDLYSMSKVELLEEVPYLYQGCVGCIGVLRQWLFQAFIYASSRRTKITKDVLEETALVPGDKNLLLDEILEGEAYFAKRTVGEDDYFKRLFGEVSPTDSKLESKTKTAVGKRKSHNDKTGLGNLDPKRKEAA